MRANPAAFKHLKRSKCETLRNLKGPLLSPLLFPVFTNIYNDSAECYPEGMTMLYADDATGFRQDDATGFRHSKKKLDKLFKSPGGCIKCEDHKNYTRGLKIVLSAYVI